MRPYCIVLADDHIMLRQGIKRIIEEVTDLEVVGEANDGLQLLSNFFTGFPLKKTTDLIKYAIRKGYTSAIT